jgi:transcriptional regulator with XRE-family HTH domain
MDIGSTLRTIRLERGLTQQALSDRVGIDRQYVVKIERGHVAAGVRVLGDICVNGLRMRLSEFIARAEAGERG